MLGNPRAVPVNPNEMERPRFLVYRNLTGVKFSGNFGTKVKQLREGFDIYRIEHYGYCMVTTFAEFNTRTTSSSRFRQGLLTNAQANQANEAEPMRNIRREVVQTPEITRHPHIVDFYGYHQVGDQTIGLVLEYMRGGTIFDIINRSPVEKVPQGALGKDDLTPERIALFSLHMARALAFLHDKLNIVHRNIKTSNVFLTWDNRTAKLGEFCYARTDDEVDGPMTAKKYPLKYSPPEVINSSQSASYGKEADVYSFSVTLCAMSQKEEPFHDQNFPSSSNFRDRLKLPEHPLRPTIKNEREVDPVLLWVIQKGWETDEERRPTMIQIVRKLEPLVPPELELR